MKGILRSALLVSLGIAVATIGPAQRTPGHPVGPRGPVRGQPPRRGPAPKPTLHPALAKLLSAADHLVYQGTRVIEFPGKASRKEHVFYAHRLMRIEELEGEKNIIIEAKDARYIYRPKSKELRRTERIGLNSQFAILGVGGAENLLVREYDGGKVAERDTVLLELLNPQGRMLQRIWADRATFAVLRRESYDGQGKMRLAFEFTEITYGGNFPSAFFEPHFPGSKLITPADDVRRLAKELKLPAFLIDPVTGFKLQGAGKLKASGEQILREFYTNKKQRVSLFILSKPVNDEVLKKFVSKNINAYTWQKDGAYLVLVGNMKVELLRELASFVRTEQRD